MTTRIPGESYVSQAHHELELERLWPRVWLLAGHAREVASVGDWFVFDVGRDSIVVAKGDDGEVRAFHNVCQHRGMRLCGAHRGRASALRCVYHHWVWGLDGRLRSGARDDTLSEVRCEIRHGFVFVHLGANPPDLADFLGPLDDRMARYRPAELGLVRDQTVTIACNWKASADVSNESYHLPMLHPELARHAEIHDVQVELLGSHSAIRVRLGTDESTRAQLRSEARQRMERDAIALALGDEQLVEKHQLYLFPNVQLNFLPFTLELYRHRPDPVTPHRCFFDEQRYERGARSPLPKRECFAHGERSLGPVMGADVDILPDLQRGLSSRGFRGMRLQQGEEPIANMHRVLATYLERE